MLCYNPTDDAIIASTPILSELNSKVHYFVSSNIGALRAFSWKTVTLGTRAIDRGCAKKLFTRTAEHWDFMT
jgi:hypothetical protein